MGVRAARLRPGRPDRHGVRRRPGDDHLRRRHRPAAAAHPGRGAGAGRGAADARRDARHRPTATRSSGPWPRSRTRPATWPTRRWRCGCPATPTGSTTLRGAVERGRALRITYYTATRDETTERVVDPMRVLMVGGRAYLEAWCRRAEAVRLFRVDRIDALTELDEPAAPPPQARPHDVSDGVFQPGAGPAAGHAAGGPGQPVDHRVLPVRGGPPGRRRVAGLAAGHRPGLGPPAGARPRPGGHRGRAAGAGRRGRATQATRRARRVRRAGAARPTRAEAP